MAAAIWALPPPTERQALSVEVDTAKETIARLEAELAKVTEQAQAATAAAAAAIRCAEGGRGEVEPGPPPPTGVGVAVSRGGDCCYVEDQIL